MQPAVSTVLAVGVAAVTGASVAVAIISAEVAAPFVGVCIVVIAMLLGWRLLPWS